MPSSVLIEDENVIWTCMYIIAAYNALTAVQQQMGAQACRTAFECSRFPSI
jgi:hypothetical protein